MPSILKLLISVVFVLAVGFSASIFTASSVEGWYLTIQKPSWNPPNWLFAPVRTAIYFMMGLALYRLWIKPVSQARTLAIVLFMAQLVLNFCWSLLFFGMQQIGWALADIVAMWALIVVCMVVFKRVDTISSALFIPYLAWVSFATALNFAIWQLNP